MQYVLSALNLKKDTFVQFAQFVLVGAVNTAVDFVVLNIFISAFGIGQNGVLYVYFKAVSFIAAVVNSYLFNKYWVFKGASSRDSRSEGLMFFGVSAIGFLVNVAVASAVFMVFSRTSLGLIHPSLASNIGALTGTVVVLLFNYFGYKFFVFRSEQQPSSSIGVS
ncbi:TPA: hypothetical protein DCQ44_03175 [Candidatus Taylorbacteria bacterium]|nr:hypothetical protein [Candidatus Taylorbacteria bacterium]